MKLKFKIGVVGAVAVLIVALATFGFAKPNAKADIISAANVSCPLATNGIVTSASSGPCVYLASQHYIPASSATAGPFTQSALDTATGQAANGPAKATNSCANAPGATSVTTANFPQAFGTFVQSTTTTTSQPTGLPLVEISNVTAANQVLNVTQPGAASTSGFSTAGLFLNNNFIYICVNPSMKQALGSLNAASIDVPLATTGSNDGDMTFSAIVQSNMGFFDQPSCGNIGGGDTVEWTNDRCAGDSGEGTAQMTIPGLNVTNDLSAVLVRFSCVFYPLSTGLVFPITINQDAGSFTFNVICKGEASATATTIKATPNTVEIIPARSNTSHSLVLLTILDSNGNPIIPGRDVDFRTDRCAIETAGLGIGTSTSAGTSILGSFITNIPVLGTLNDGPTIVSLGSALGLVNSLNTAAPGTYLSWEYSAAAQTTIDPTGAFAPQADLTKVIDGFDLNANGVPDNSLAGAILSCNPVQAAGVTPGTANVTACVAVLNGLDVCVATTVKVIGPPASITVAASPTSVVCGEKSTITATVVDSIGQSVSDHTRVELVTNLGGVIGGTGAVAGFAANIAPISSSVADTFGGVATAFLITSDVTSGPYEVIATSGGTTSGDFAVTGPFPFGTQQLNIFTVNAQGTPVSLPSTTGSFSPLSIPITQTYLGGQFSTPPVSAQVTVSCSLPTTPAPIVAAPAITAPRTGTGIIPPNTGDAGLASTSGSNWTLFALGSAIALTLAGLATVKFARR